MSCWEEETCCFDPEELLIEQYYERERAKEYKKKLRALEHNTIHITERVYPHSPLWITQDGQRLKIEDMTTTHIKNCLKLIYKSNGKWRNQFIRPFECELRKRKYQEQFI